MLLMHELRWDGDDEVSYLGRRDDLDLPIREFVGVAGEFALVHDGTVLHGGLGRNLVYAHDEQVTLPVVVSHGKFSVVA